MNATPAQLEKEFKKFGPIKSGGVQVRSNKVTCHSITYFLFFGSLCCIMPSVCLIWILMLQQQGFCFGFVEFEVASAVQSAIEVYLHVPKMDATVSYHVFQLID